MLSIRSFNGDKYEWYPVKPYKTYDGGFIVPYNTNSPNNNIDGSCYNNSYETVSVFEKYSANGDLEWKRCVQNTNDSSYYYMFPTSDGNFVLGGASFKSFSRDFLLKKIDNAGNILWSKRYGGSGTEFLGNIIATDDEGYVVTGRTYSKDGDVGQHYGSEFFTDIWVLKLDKNGNIVWKRVIGGSSEDDLPTIIKGPLNGFYLVGQTQSEDYDFNNPRGSVDAIAVRLDKDGNTVWSTCLGGSGADGAWSAVMDEDQNLILAGYTKSGDGDIQGYSGAEDDGWVIALDSSKNFLWSKCYHTGTGHNVFKDICLAIDNTVWLTGYTSRDLFASITGWVLQIDNTGIKKQEKIVTGCPSRHEGGFVYPLANNTIIQGGFYNSLPEPGSIIPKVYLGVGFGAQDLYLATFAPWPTGIQSAFDPVRPISLYPNPAVSVININLPVDNQQNNISIMDIAGRTVKNLNTSGNNSAAILLDVHDWNRGGISFKSEWHAC